jgi:hypothetical protein
LDAPHVVLVTLSQLPANVVVGGRNTTIAKKFALLAARCFVRRRGHSALHEWCWGTPKFSLRRQLNNGGNLLLFHSRVFTLNWATEKKFVAKALCYLKWFMCGV